MDTPDSERLARELELRKRLQEALLVFSRGIAARLSLPTALESFARDVNELFGATRTCIWLYDRDARVLSLAGSSDPRDSASSVMHGDDESPIVRALGGTAPEKVGSGDTSCLTVPLRGWRRALGTLVIDGEPSRLPAELFIELSGELARQLSVVVENRIVLEESIQRHHDYEDTKARLAQAQKLASLGQLVAAVAHEMKNPLQGALGHLELFLATTDLDPSHRATLERVYNDTDRAAKIVQNLLVFAGSQRPARRRIDMPQLIAETVALREATPHRPQVEIICRGEGAAPVLGDPTLLQQALLNIVVNAEQAIAGSTGSGQVIVTSRRDDGFVSVDIEDTGPGIASDLVPKIFEPFFTTKDIGKGTGLGLAITYRIIHEHGGTVWAGASPAGGAMFTIQLPAAQ